MVLYFSATGNTKYIAQLIAKELGDETLDLLERIKTSDRSVIRSPKPYVICSPVYICEMPKFLVEFIKRQKFAGNRKVYFVFTCGGAAGISGAVARDIINGKKMVYMGCESIKMANNYVASNTFKVTPDDEVIFRIKQAKVSVDKIVLSINEGRKLTGRNGMLIERALMTPLTPMWNKFMQPSKPFYTTDKCIGCGKCVRMCPLNNIRLADNRPVWDAPCAHCMACICNCPTEAIEYGDITQTKLKYNINKFIGKI